MPLASTILAIPSKKTLSLPGQTCVLDERMQMPLQRPQQGRERPKLQVPLRRREGDRREDQLKWVMRAWLLWLPPLIAPWNSPTTIIGSCAGGDDIQQSISNPNFAELNDPRAPAKTSQPHLQTKPAFRTGHCRRNHDTCEPSSKSQHIHNYHALPDPSLPISWHSKLPKEHVKLL